MPKLLSTLMRAQIALLGPIFERMDLEMQRKLQDALGTLEAKVLAGSVQYREEPFDDFDAEWAFVEDSVPQKAILYLHGGAYVSGSLAYAKGFGGVLAEYTHLDTLCVGYRLAPEHPFPAALDDALHAYQRMLERYAPGDIAFVGESAGGGLCYCLALKLKELYMPQPGCIVALSPWTDLTLSGSSFQRNLDHDIILKREGLEHCAALYAGEHTGDPLVSPLFGDLSGIANSLIYAGNHEILEDDAVLMAQRLLLHGCNCELHVEEGMWHVYVLYGIPEAKDALARMGQFILEETADGKKA